MKKNNWHIIINLFSIIALLSGMVFIRATPALAATTLSVTPITWNVIGLDSNNPAVGPNAFPVGARVCYTGDEPASLTATFVWDSTNPYINLSGATDDVVTLDPGLATSNCTDFYYEVEITRTSAAYNATRRYHISVTDGATTVSTPTPRELYVEKLVSQSRNGQQNLELSDDGTNFDTFAPGETLTLMVGGTYFVRLTASTATNGYEQIESYLSLPNVYFQVLSVTTDYTVGTDTNLLYGDACTWENNPYSLNYRSCLSTGKMGGGVITTYKVKILQYRSGDPTPVYGMIYDFSGSSYHYNSDYMSDARDFFNFDPAMVDLTKTFVPDALSPGGVSQMVINVTNPGGLEITGVNFTDTFPTTPGAMTIANTTTSTVGCGSINLVAPIGSGTFTSGAASISASNITLAPNSTCTIKVNVTVPTNPTSGTYTNTTSHLYIDGTTDTGNFATDDLVVATNVVACTTSENMASWIINSGAATPPIYDSKSAIVNTATASVTVGSPGDIVLAAGDYVWDATGVWGNSTSYDATKYFEFRIDTTQFKDITWGFNLIRTVSKDPRRFNVTYTPNGGSETDLNVTDFEITDTGVFHSYSYTIGTGYLAAGVTAFRIYPYYGTNNGNDLAAVVDDIIFTGTSCEPPPPSISKVFSDGEIIVGETTPLTFTISNTSSDPISKPLTGVSFVDVLPEGLQITSEPQSNTCGGTFTAADGTQLISLSNVSMAAGATCTVSVTVIGLEAGEYTNVSGRISSTESGVNLGTSGFATDDITVIAPPSITKNFVADNMMTGDITSLSFTITNQNPSVALTGVAFTDTLPTGLVVATPNGLTTTCVGGSITATAGTGSITLSGLTLSGYASCEIKLDVLGVTAGAKINSVTVSSTNGGTGNTASDTLYMQDPLPGIGLLKQVATSGSGPWYSFLTDVPSGSTVYYMITVENTGDVPLTGYAVVDNRVSLSSCSWTNPLPVAVPANENHITTCVVSTTVAAGVLKNTATASGTYNSIPYSAFDDAWYSTPGNYGHLPYSDYDLMNLFLEGGARHLTDGSGTGAYLGSTVPAEVDGSSSDAYGDEVTDDGVAFTGTWVYGVNGGSMNITVFCPSGTCTLAGWIDWNDDGNFDDESENVVLANNVTSGTNPYTFTIPGAANLVNALIYSRFRLYASAPGTVSPLGEAKTSGTATVGEVEDYEIVMTGGDPTAITLPDGPTCTVDSAIHINWVTTNEMEILGFRLYRSVGLETTRSLIYQTAAVFSGKMIGAEYIFTDLDTVVNTRYYYWLEVVQVDGTSTIMAPATAGMFEFKILLPFIHR